MKLKINLGGWFKAARPKDTEKEKEQVANVFGKIWHGIEKVVSVGSSVASNPITLGIISAVAPEAAAVGGAAWLAFHVAGMVTQAENLYKSVAGKKGAEKLAAVTDGMLKLLDQFNIIAPDGYQVDVNQPEITKLINMQVDTIKQAEVVRQTIKFKKIDPNAPDATVPIAAAA